MADVIIKGMEMPESCYGRDLANFFTDETPYCCRKMRVVAPTGKRPDWCPLHPAPEWISVDYNNPETLPCTEKSILYCAFGRSVGEGYYRGFDGEHHVWKMYAVAGTHWDYEVTHWMPLPKPPGGDAT